jgi:hypothetical protein
VQNSFTKEWILAPRGVGKNKNGKQKTQIELTENEHPLKELSNIYQSNKEERQQDAKSTKVSCKGLHQCTK